MSQRLFDLIHNREGAGTPAPSTGAAGYFYKLSTYFWQFLFINCLFLLASLPIITIPAALAAVNRVCIKTIRDGVVLVWYEFRDEFKSSFKKGFLMGLYFAVWMFAAYYLLSLGMTNWENPFGVMFLAAGLIMVAVLLVWAAYAFVLLASLDLPAGQLLRNARALMFLGGRWTAAVFGVLLCVIGLVVLFFPISVIPLLIGGIALTQYTLCWFVNHPMQDQIIAPYERSVAAVETEKTT